MLSGIKGEQDITALCESASITRNVYDQWVDIFITGGKQKLETSDMESGASVLADQTFLRNLVERFPGYLLISKFDNGEILYSSPELTQQLSEIKHALNRWVDHDARLKFLETLEKDGYIENVPIVLSRADGTQFIMKFSSRLLEQHGEKVIVSCSAHSSDDEPNYQELENANAQFHEALEAFDEGFVMWDADFKLVLENERMFKMLYPNSQPPRIAQPGDDFKFVLSEQFANGVYKKPFGIPAKLVIAGFERLIRNYAKNVNVELKDGRIMCGSSHRTSHGGYLLTFKEVTEQHRAQKAEKDAGGLLRAAIEALDEGVMLYDPNLCLELHNNKAKEIFFEGKEDFELGGSFYELCEYYAMKKILVVPEGVSKEEWATLSVRDVMNGVKNSELTTTAGRKILASSYRTNMGGYLFTFRDITEQFRAQTAEQAANELLRDAIESLDEGVMLYDKDLHLELFNQKANKLFFDGKGDFKIGNTFYEICEYFALSGILVMPEGLSKEDWANFAVQDVRDYAINSQITTVEGRLLLASSHKTNSGGYLLTFKDVTEQQTMQSELEQERYRAHQNEKLSALGELLAGVAHELNNPLSIVVGYSLMLQDNIRDPVQRKRIERISQAAERCAKIVKMFLAMARQNPLEIENSSLNEILKMVVDIGLSDIEDAAIEFSLDPNLPDVEVDADQMAQVFTNLIMNARQALTDNEENGRINVSSRYEKRSNNVVVSISDNGIGISKDIQKRIFEPLFTTKESGVGTGVGLALSHRIVSSHGGELSVESDLGAGATFHVRLEAARKLRQVISEPSSEDELTKVLKICVIDDEEDVASMIQEILENTGHLVDVYNSPQSALEQCKAKHFDVILCDMKMPEMNGQEFYKAFMASSFSNKTKIAFITGDTMSPTVAKFFKKTSVAYLEKPIVPNELLALVGELYEKDRTNK